MLHRQDTRSPQSQTRSDLGDRRIKPRYRNRQVVPALFRQRPPTKVEAKKYGQYAHIPLHPKQTNLPQQQRELLQNEPTVNNLTPEQLDAIEKYSIKLDAITDLKKLRWQVLANYRQNLIMHNTYLRILSHHWEINLEAQDTFND